MIQNKKIAAVCVAEMQNDDIQSILYPLNEALSEIGWRMIIFDSCTDFFLKNAFDEGEAHLFQLLNHDYIDAVLIMSRTIKNDEIKNQIINRARQNGTPVLLIDSDTRPEGTIQISFDESEPFIMRELVKAIFLKTHIVIIIYIIETDNMNPFNRIKQLLCKIRADESRSASDQYSGIMQINCVLHFSSSTSLCWVGICKQRMYSSPRERI